MSDSIISRELSAVRLCTLAVGKGDRRGSQPRRQSSGSRFAAFQSWMALLPDSPHKLATAAHVFRDTAHLVYPLVQLHLRARA